MSHTMNRPSEILESLRVATAKMAPVWPLDRFVAVNPYLGLQDRDFVDAVALLERVAGARSTMGAEDFRACMSRGELSHADIDRAIAEARSALTSEEIVGMLDATTLSSPRPEVMTVAEVLDEASEFSWSRFATDHVGAFLACHFDESHAAWQPTRDPSLFATWRAEAEIDRTPEVMGAKGFRAIIASLPLSFEDAACAALARLGVPSSGLDLYLHRLLMRVGGWSAYAARIVWDQKLGANVDDDTLVELLVILLAFELGLYETLGRRRAEHRWRSACREMTRRANLSPYGGPTEARVILQRAYELGFQRKLIAHLSARPEEATTDPAETCGEGRPWAQAVFCIDVRSEVFRRHLEATDPQIETLGFAGFFGFPVELVPLGHRGGSAQCPVLLSPRHRVLEHIADERTRAAALRRRTDAHAVRRAWQSFKMGAISCFSFVGPIGLSYLPKLFTDGSGLTRPVPHPSTEGLGHFADERTVDLDEGIVGGKRTGIPMAERIELAANALRGMSLTTGFARLVVLAGHGSTSVNNPHASGLDCGACGGRSGEPNARVATAILNDPAVRRGLRGRGIDIPDDTVFVAAQHDTTTDDVTIFARGQVPSSHLEDLEQLERSLQEAGRTCRVERARRLHGSRASADDEWARRSRDWAQVRPEWGLAGCAAFIVAPRQATAALDLEGRAFLHSYSWEQDAEFSVLELIMTAPMVVASWINLQYYASTVDPDIFGAGNKTLHNVVGGSVGVLEGHTGDLRIGLPWQSVHDGEQFQHEPVRLNVMIEAPVEAMNAVIEKHETVRQLLDNGWIHLFALEAGRPTQRYLGDSSWCAVGARPIDEEGRAWSQAS